MTRIFILRFFESYFRHRWLYLLPVVITMAAAAIYFYTYVPKYSARGILYVNGQSLLTSLSSASSNDNTWWLTPAQATSSEMNELLQTNAFVRAIVKDTDLETYMSSGQDQVFEVIDAVRKSISLSPVGNNEVSISASFEDPRIAFQLVHSVIDSYTRWQVNTKRIDSQVAQDFFNALILSHGNDLEAARQKLRDYYDIYPPPVRGERPITQELEIERLQNEIALAGSRYESALQKEEEAKLVMTQIDSEVRHTYMLMDAPLLPERPDFSKKRVAMQAAIFLAAGMILSLIGISGGTFLDRTFRFPVDVHTRLNLPVLALLPDSPTPWKLRTFVTSAFRMKRKRVTDAPEDMPSDQAESSLANTQAQNAEQPLDIRI